MKRKEGIFDIDGVQNRQPPYMPLWHINYFESKLLKKQPIKKGTYQTSFVPLKAGYKIFMWNVPFLYQEKYILITRDREFRAKVYINKPCPTSLIYYPRPKLLFLSILYKFTVSLCKTYKSYLPGHFFGSHISMSIPMYEIKFFSLINLPYINLTIRAAKEPSREERSHFLS